MSVRIIGIATVLSVFSLVLGTASSNGAESLYARWSHGPSADSAYFPIAVWGQNTRYASRYKAAGMNLYISLWNNGPTEEQLSELRAAGMRTICSQNEVGMRNIHDPVIAGWMDGEEPDNAQELPGGGYGPPILPEVVINKNNSMRAADPSRPVFLNLGRGVAWDGWYGRGPRTNHPEDYLEYVKAGDIVSFDIYPMASPDPEIHGKLWYTAYGVERLCDWAGPRKPVWNCIECTSIFTEARATPEQVRSAVWMSIISGSRGIIYFAHAMYPEINDLALLDDPEMLATVTGLNAQIRKLAPVLNSGASKAVAKVHTSNAAVPIGILVKEYQESVYIFAAGMREGTTRVTFDVGDIAESAVADVLEEERTIRFTDGKFVDDFGSYQVHIYCINPITDVSEENLPAVISISSHPNPFNPSATVTFTLPRASRADLAVYDITGRKVRTMSDGGTYRAGTHSMVWNGRDERGIPVSSGVYIARLATESHTVSRLMTLVK